MVLSLKSTLIKMSGNNSVIRIENGLRTKHLEGFGKCIQCKFCKFEWFFGEQTPNIHEKLCQENQWLKRILYGRE